MFAFKLLVWNAEGVYLFLCLKCLGLSLIPIFLYVGIFLQNTGSIKFLKFSETKMWEGSNAYTNLNFLM